MPDTIYRYTVTLVDQRAHKSTVSYLMPLSEATEVENFTIAATDAALINTALDAVTDANIFSETLSALLSGTSSLPVSADVTDEAAIVCFLSEAAEIPKYHVLRIPAPIDALFEADEKTVDETNAALIAFVDAVSETNSVQVSDGEQINVDLENGISHGFWRSVKKSGQ